MGAQNIFFVGPTGAGKTSVGKRVAATLDLPFVDLDREIEKKTGAPVQLIFDVEGEEGFRNWETRTLTEVLERSPLALATGAGCVLRKHNRESLRAKGCIVYLRTPVTIQLARLERDRSRPLIASPNRREVLETMAERRNHLYEQMADLVIDAQNWSVQQTAEKVIEHLKVRTCQERP